MLSRNRRSGPGLAFLVAIGPVDHGGVLAAVLWLILVIVLRLVKAWISRRARRIAETRRIDYAELTANLSDGTRFVFLVIAAAFLASFALPLEARDSATIRTTALIVLLIQAGIWGHVAVAFFVARYTTQRLLTDASSVTMVSALGVFARLVIISVVVLLALANLGIDITAMVAGLGIGGVAVALAAQNILGDLFASASIVLDKPFVMGDFVIVGDHKGTIERIGLKTTRIRSLSGEQLIFSNNDLLQSRVRNFKRMTERRVVFSIGVIYQTPYDRVAAIPTLLRAAVEAQEAVRFDRAHFVAYGAFSLNFEIVYYVLSPDYNRYMDIQQAINLAIYREFESQGIEFAYPTQTIFVERPETEKLHGESSVGELPKNEGADSLHHGIFKQMR
jgi:small-conductance mechanosensitive channel